MNWDPSSAAATATTPAHTPMLKSQWDETPSHQQQKGGETPGQSIMVTPGQSTRAWAETPGHATPGAVTPGRISMGTPAVGVSHSATPGGTPATATGGRKNRWDETPKTERETPGRTLGWAETPGRVSEDKVGDTPSGSGTSKRRSRWDLTPTAATPVAGAHTPGATPQAFTPGGGTPTSFTPNAKGMITPGGATPSMFTPSGVTPQGAKAFGLQTPSSQQLLSMTPEQLQVRATLSMLLLWLLAKYKLVSLLGLRC